MFGDLLSSLFGILLVHRILSLLEKFEVLSTAMLGFLFFILQLPLYFCLYFKELSSLVTIYIGIFGIFLILNEKIILISKEVSFEILHLQLIERLILHLHAGKSAQASLKCVFADLTMWQKSVFVMLNEVFEINSVPTSTKNAFHSFYFEELALILKSSSHIAEQLKRFRVGLATQRNLRHKSRQATQQIRAQAVVCAVLYVLIMIFSHAYLNLRVFSLSTGASIGLFVAGEFLIFVLGGKIKWKT